MYCASVSARIAQRRTAKESTGEAGSGRGGRPAGQDKERRLSGSKGERGRVRLGLRSRSCPGFAGTRSRWERMVNKKRVKEKDSTRYRNCIFIVKNA